MKHVIDWLFDTKRPLRFALVALIIGLATFRRKSVISDLGPVM